MPARRRILSQTAVPCALRDPFACLRSVRLSASRTLCECINRRYLHFNGFKMKLRLYYTTPLSPLSTPMQTLTGSTFPIKERGYVSTARTDTLRAWAAMGSGDTSPARVQGRGGPAGATGQSPVSAEGVIFDGIRIRRFRRCIRRDGLFAGGPPEFAPKAYPRSLSVSHGAEDARHTPDRSPVSRSRPRPRGGTPHPCQGP